MASATASDERVLAEAERLARHGEVDAGIDLLTTANRAHRRAAIEQALVHLRRVGCAARPAANLTPAGTPVIAEQPVGEVVEVLAGDLTVATLRAGLATSGCLLVRGLLPIERARRLADGIDAAFAAQDAALVGDEFDDAWYSPFDMPDRISPDDAGAAVHVVPGSPPAPHLPVRAHRRFTREAGGIWAVDSPRMLFEHLEVLSDLGLRDLITEFLGERPFLSANKCTLRRVPPDEMIGGWHQDGAFLGNDVAALNLWVSLSHCGRDAPGLDLVPRRFDAILESGSDAAVFKWSLSDDDATIAAGAAGVARPAFEPGDALLFDHRLVHRTATSPDMTRPRHAIESWFFGPSAFPASQLPLVC